MSKEYPIGSILLWQPKEPYKNKLEIGPYLIDNYSVQNSFYILDGFQRLSTLFGCLTNPNKTKLQVNFALLKKEYSLNYELEEEAFNMNQSGTITNIPVYVLIDTYEFLDYCDKLRTQINDNEKSRRLVDRAKKLSSTLIDYQIPSIEILGGSIKDAVDIFSRVNSKGITISPDWMLSALTSSEADDFNLGDLLGNLISDLAEYNFERIGRDILVQCISNCFGKVYFDQRIEELAKRKDFKEVTYKSIEAIKKAIRFLFEEVLVIDRRLLPYNSQLIFLSYFFIEIESPNDNQKRKLKEWFWTTYSNYFTIYSLSKIRHAFEQFKRFAKNESDNPLYYDKPNQKFSIADLPNSVNVKSVRSTTFVLFLLNYSNDFKSVVSSEIDSLKVSYLFGRNNSHANSFPLIEHINKWDERFLFGSIKRNDMSIVFKDKNFASYSELFFLNNEMVDIYNSTLEEKEKEDKILEIRLNLIESAERKFVKKFGITYDD
ncbi:MAG: DUF262 domain-containing protein [Bacteroidetes bacterium]|nr:DUF262 domain-containing protein [Bacteroidota bacterium]